MSFFQKKNRIFTQGGVYMKNKIKMQEVIFESGAVVRWREGGFPFCSCFMGKLVEVLPLFPYCAHVHLIAIKKNRGEL